MSARRSAGASLTPSPVIATTWPSARRASAIRSFASGELRAKISSLALAQQARRARLRSCASSSRPVTTVGFAPAMPTRRAIAAAVRPWSPVTTMIRMPGLRGSARRRPATSGRGGSSIATSPRKQQVALGLARGARARRRSAASRRGRQRARAGPRPRSRRRRARARVALGVGRAGAPGRRRRDRRAQRGRSASGAPLVSIHEPPSPVVDGRHQLQRRVEVELGRTPVGRAPRVDVRAQARGREQHRELGRVAGRRAVRVEPARCCRPPSPRRAARRRARSVRSPRRPRGRARRPPSRRA